MWNLQGGRAQSAAGVRDPFDLHVLHVDFVFGCPKPPLVAPSQPTWGGQIIGQFLGVGGLLKTQHLAYVSVDGQA